MAQPSVISHFTFTPLRNVKCEMAYILSRGPYGGFVVDCDVILIYFATTLDELRVIEVAVGGEESLQFISVLSLTAENPPTV